MSSPSQEEPTAVVTQKNNEYGLLIALQRKIRASSNFSGASIPYVRGRVLKGTGLMVYGDISEDRLSDLIEGNSKMNGNLTVDYRGFAALPAEDEPLIEETSPQTDHSDNALALRVAELEREKAVLGIQNNRLNQELEGAEEFTLDILQENEELERQRGDLEQRIGLGPDIGTTATPLDSKRINAYYIRGIKEIELPNLEAISSLYDELMGIQGVDYGTLENAVKIVKTPLDEDPIYQGLIKDRDGAIESIEALGDVSEGEEKANVTEMLEGIKGKAVEKISAREEEYQKAIETVQSFKSFFDGSNFHYLFTQAETEEDHIICVTTPIPYREGDEQYQSLEVDLLNHLHNEWSKLREEVRGDFERVSNNGLVQYDFKVPKSYKTREEIDGIRKKFERDLFSSQVDYLFARLGLRVDIVSEANTDGLPLSVDQVVQESLPGSSLSTESIARAGSGITYVNELSPQMATEYVALAEQARSQGVKITDDPFEFKRNAKSPEYALVIPVVLASMGTGTSKRIDMIDNVRERIGDKFENQKNILSAVDSALRTLENKGVINSRDRGTYGINNQYLTTHNG